MRLALHICNGYTLALWSALAALTVVSGVVPIPHMTPILHYGIYGPLKMACFLMIGYFTPLAFASFSVLNRGFAFAAASAAAVEILQGFIGNGHSFHVYELTIKWFVIPFGFMFGLDARTEGALDLGFLHIALLKNQRSQNQR
jgi:hypothetical protein